MIYYRLGAARYWTGETAERANPHPDWTAKTPPVLQEGEYARLTLAGWQVTDIPPPAKVVAANAVSAPDVPQSITGRQARLVLLGAGLLDAVEQTIEGIPGTEGKAARIEWGHASVIERHNPVFAAMAAALGLTDEQIDQMFITGAAL